MLFWRLYSQRTLINRIFERMSNGENEINFAFILSKNSLLISEPKKH